jgi:hypothetical protein
MLLNVYLGIKAAVRMNSLMHSDHLHNETKEEFQSTADYFTPLSRSEPMSSQRPMTSYLKGKTVNVRVSRRPVVEEMWNEEFEDLFFSWQRLTNPQHRRLAIVIIRSLAASA